MFSELPKLVFQLSSRGDLEKIKQIFAYVKRYNISMEEMGVKNDNYNQRKKQTLVDTNSFYRKRTPLISAARHGHHKVCNYLITEENANIEARDDDQNTALILAAIHNRTEVIKVLLRHKANIKAQNKDKYHAAYWAAFHGNLEDLKMLVEKDRDVINLKGWHRQTPLTIASRRGNLDVCRFLWKRNPQPNF